MTFLGVAVVMILIVCVVIKNKLDSRKISNKNPTEKNKARDEKCLSRPGKRSQAMAIFNYRKPLKELPQCQTSVSEQQGRLHLVQPI